ncbi:MAG: DUF429 domain-containing protein [Sedimentisphaerales bacterium]
MTKKLTNTLIRLIGKAGPCKRSFQVAGVDGCRAGWFVVIISVVKKGSGANVTCIFNSKDFFLAKTFAEVLSKTTNCKLVCVDIPIGLSDGEKPRECDVVARKILRGGRASSIFPPPIRPCLSAKDSETASRICFKYSGKKLNRQSFFILPKVREVNQAMTPQLQRRVCEIHPELAFWALNGKKPMQHKKRQLAGRNERMRLLSTIFPDVGQLVAKARKPKEVAPDDILDALAAAWTASQIVSGKAETLPKNQELDSKGLRMEILYPAPIVDE